MTPKDNALKVKLSFHIETEVTFDDDMIDELKEKLKEDGVTGTPDKSELLAAIQEMASDNPENIFPTSEMLCNNMELTSFEGDVPEIEINDDPDDGENEADANHKIRKAEGI